MDSLRADLSESNMVFIHSDLDDAGLSQAAFRLFCHLSRRAGRAGLYPTAKSMAEVCRMNKDTVWQGLAELEERGMLKRNPRLGSSTEYVLQPPSTWRKRGGGGKEGVTPDSLCGVTPDFQRGVAEKRGRKEYPMKDIHEDTPSAAAATQELGFNLPENVPQQKPQRRADECFTLLATLQGSKPSDLTKSERGRLNKALSEIRSACPNLSAEQLRRRADAYREAMPGATLTATALAAHWSRLAGSEPADLTEKKLGGAARHFDRATVAAAPGRWEAAFEDLYDLPPDGEWHQQQPYVREAIEAYLRETSAPSSAA